MVHRLLQDSSRMSRFQGQQVREISSSKNLRSPSRRAKLAMLPRVQRMAPMMRQQLCRRPMYGTIPMLARRLFQDSSRKSRLRLYSGMGNVTRDKTGCAGSNCSVSAPNILCPHQMFPKDVGHVFGRWLTCMTFQIRQGCVHNR